MSDEADENSAFWTEIFGRVREEQKSIILRLDKLLENLGYLYGKR